MKAKEALKILNVSRQTLSNYVKRGVIVATREPHSARFDYDADSVYAVAGYVNHKDVCLYVQTPIASNVGCVDVREQLSLLERLSAARGWTIGDTYIDEWGSTHYLEKLMSKLATKQTYKHVVIYSLQAISHDNRVLLNHACKSHPMTSLVVFNGG